jgi:chromosome segregation ATPase
MEALVDLSITYKLVDGVKDAWKDVPILFADDRQRYAQLVNSSNQVLELKKQTQLQEGSTLISQTKWLPPIKQEESIFQRQIEERDRQLTLLRNDFQLLHHKNVTLQQQINTNDSKTVLLQKENQGLKLKVSSLEHQGREKDNKINVLENEQHGHHRTSIQQTQTLNSLKQEKQTMEQERMGATNEVERLKSSYVILEQLLIAKQDTIMSLKRENQMLSTANQGNQQGANEMVDTLKTLLQSKNNEIELLKQNMEHLLANEQRRNDALEQENKMLKQEMPQQKANVQSAGPSNVNPTNSDSSHHDRHDNSYNDSNYESEKSDTGDINYDTPSEDEDNNNHLNYDDVNESNK